MSFRMPLWVYWTLAVGAVVAAAYFTAQLDLAAYGDEASRLLFVVWGGPLTLVVAAALVTWLKRKHG